MGGQEPDGVTSTGDAGALARLSAALDTADTGFPIVTP
ncbi:MULTISPECIES: alkyl sulfatase C-terminal domain-containing protein [unclassified Streptomyces]